LNAPDVVWGSPSIQGITVRADFFVLPVAAYQAVLGVQWLETLGPIKTDYKKLSMSFTQAGRTHMISDVKPIEDTKLPPDLSQILSEFAHVFEEPTELPPTSSHDHRISLLPNQPLVTQDLTGTPITKKMRSKKWLKNSFNPKLFALVGVHFRHQYC